MFDDQSGYQPDRLAYAGWDERLRCRRRETCPCCSARALRHFQPKGTTCGGTRCRVTHPAAPARGTVVLMR